ncbi:NAD(P)H-dependent oxidoreductase [Chromatiaceae bacterium AAb-1]|nr:NAD(P)H-dependent oxidoreductase [Chromatiaceae bacterium AAb-1]
MKTLLRIDTSIRLTDSNTRELSGYFEQAWLQANPDGKVIRRCLATSPVPHLSQEIYEAFQASGGRADASAISDTLIEEIKLADHIVIGSPLYNFSLPSSLKAYFDYIVRSGLTFEVRQGHYQGLLNGKRATLVTARGGFSSPDDADDFQSDYLRKILAFIGITHVNTVKLEGTGVEQHNKNAALSRAKREIEQLFSPDQSPAWLGEFSEQDKKEISYLRARQAEVITAGDAGAYAELCTEDIQLLIPARDLVSGKNAFLQAEEALFRSAKFVNFRKIPLSVERSGNLAIEVGRQEAQMQHQDQSEGVFSANQKYMHVFRHTCQGWRFALLMSNASG